MLCYWPGDYGTKGRPIINTDENEMGCVVSLFSIAMFCAYGAAGSQLRQGGVWAGVVSLFHRGSPVEMCMAFWLDSLNIGVWTITLMHVD